MKTFPSNARCASIRTKFLKGRKPFNVCLTRQQLAPTTFYRLIREHELLNLETTQKLRTSFAMQYANELWQGDTMHGPRIKQADGRWKKTFLIGFIDDASRLITHAEFFYNDNTDTMIEAFKTALYKRGRPERLYFDNGSNYTSKEILQACIRLNIRLSHAPIRDGAAKGKIERFFRGFRDRFLVMHTQFDSLEQLNQLTQDWVENHYNTQPHSGIQMRPLDRFNLDPVLSLLDELRDTLWQVYGSDITEYYQQLYAKKPHTENAELSEHQLALFAPEQDDIIPF